MKIFTRTLNNYTYTYSSTSQLFRIRYSRCQNLEWDAKWIEKFVKEILQKRNKKALLNILETEDFYIKSDEIMVKFKHGKLKQMELAVAQYLWCT